MQRWDIVSEIHFVLYLRAHILCVCKMCQTHCITANGNENENEKKAILITNKISYHSHAFVRGAIVFIARFFKWIRSIVACQNAR